MSIRSSALLSLYVGFFLIFLYAPTLLLPLFAFNDSTIVAFPLSGFTTAWFAGLLDVPALHEATINSLAVALTSAVLATCLGILAARATTRYRFRLMHGMLGLIMLPMVLPEMIIAVAFLVVILHLGFSLSLFSIILGHVLLCTPFSVAILRTAFQGLDHNYEDASTDLGYSRWATFRLIIVPMVLPGVVASLLISFTISLDEFIIAFFLSGTETTLPVYIWGQLRFPQRVPNVLALGTLLLAISLGLMITAEFFRRRGLRKLGLSTQESVL
ncbi:MAG: ABC transporter permease [Rhodobacteraceae bacterium]|nr:ABC transporter permease [Paracoccaceae bacterium]